MIWKTGLVMLLIFCAAAVYAGGEYQASQRTQTTRQSGPPPYPAELECRYQAYQSMARTTSYWQAPAAIPFSPCGRFAPNVHDSFGFGPNVDGYDFAPGGRLEPVTPAMMGVALWYFGIPPYPLPHGPAVPGFW